MQSEYIVASESTREAIWLGGVADCLSIWESLRLDWMFYAATTKNPLVLAYNHLAHKGSKHIEVRYHFIREQLASGTIKVEYVDTTQQLADVLTKAVDG